MVIKSINGAMLRKMILNGAKLLDSNKQHVDSLNVFPVPDGDTGTNMSLTFVSAAKEITSCPNNNIDMLCECIARGALRGARGNSGVISSQILKGMCNELCKCEGKITLKEFAQSLVTGSEIAYKAVTKPQEGTILTVIRCMSEAGIKFAKRSQDFSDFFKTVLKVGEETLKKTPEMLPVLKKAGVVDAGGRGLLIVFQGFYDSLTGKEDVNLEFDDSIKKVSEGKTNNYEQFHVNLNELSDIEFAYCTEFFVINLVEGLNDNDIDNFRNNLMSIGDCVLVINDSELIKVHVHTNNPGKALSYAIELGELDKIKIENMLEQNRALARYEKEDLKPYGMVSVCSGNGIAEIFKELTVDEIVEGGQTMNPSAEDIANACDRVYAENVFVFPNNKNIILAANQAKEISKRNVIVIPTTNVPQGFSAVLGFNPSENVETNTEMMTEAIKSVRVGSVTFAVRDTVTDNFEIKENDIIGLSDKEILCAGKNVSEVAEQLVSGLYDEEVCTITLYYGYGTSEKEASELCSKLAEKYPDCDIDMHEGGQALYYYIISLD
ncbi:MAG: DAK2 domain-containing protein [Clostridia bacterium]|nr:DAK2 domain-containing protein [Clostridia bacterium]